MESSLPHRLLGRDEKLSLDRPAGATVQKWMGKLLFISHVLTRISPMRSDTFSLKSFRLPLLLTAGTLIWLYTTGLWLLPAWQIPNAYAQDALEVLARFKLSGDLGFGFLFNKAMPQLGAPWTADWAAYPMPDVPVFILFGKIAAVIGLIPASNLALLFAHLSAVAAFYVSSRALGHRAIFAAGAALLFAFSFYITFRGLSHYSFALAYVVPAQLVSAWLIGGSRRLVAQPRWKIFCLATACATAVGSPYFGFGYCQLLLFALVYQAVTARQRQTLVLGLCCFAAFAVTFVFLNYSSLLAMAGEPSGVLQRNYASTEIYGLRPIELLIPPATHHWSLAAGIAQRYAASTRLKGELFSPYLGLAGLCGLLVIVISAGLRLGRSRAGLRPAHAAISAWLICFFMVGGLNSLLAFVGVDLFRGGNRYSIYLLAVALLALASWGTRRGRHLTRGAALALTAAVVLIGLWDELPKSRSVAEKRAIGAKIAADRALAATLERALPSGAAVFQLPAVPFLEQAPINRMTDYELFRPWLYTKNLRFSYGLLVSHQALRWQKWITSQPVGPMCAALEAAGFSALYIHKAAFPDFGASLQQELAALDKKLLFEAGDHVVFALDAQPQPSWPDLNDRHLADPWNRTLEPDGQPQLFATDGWLSLEQNGPNVWRWAGQTATLTIWCPGDKPAESLLQFGVSALRPVRLDATFQGQNIWHIVARQSPPVEVNLRLTLQPGANTITFRYEGRPTQPSLSDARLLGFRIDNLRVMPGLRP